MFPHRSTLGEWRQGPLFDSGGGLTQLSRCTMEARPVREKGSAEASNSSKWVLKREKFGQGSPAPSLGAEVVCWGTHLRCRSFQGLLHRYLSGIAGQLSLVT